MYDEEKNGKHHVFLFLFGISRYSSHSSKLISIQAAYSSFVYYISQYDLYSDTILNPKEGEILGNIFAVIYVILGCTLSPLLGAILDFIGFLPVRLSAFFFF